MRFKLTPKRIEKISDILSDLALVNFASVVLPAALDKLDVNKLVLGLTAAIAFWIASLIIRK